MLGAADCLTSLGEITLRQSDHDAARQYYEKVLPLYRAIGSAVGEASYIKKLGDIALDRSAYDSAREHYEKALHLSLGNVAGERSDHDAEREHYQKALPLYRQIGHVQGEANCIKALGKIALHHSGRSRLHPKPRHIALVHAEPDNARSQYRAALALYERLPEPHSIGRKHRRLARIARDDAERERHLQAAREAWRSMKRDDLIRQLDEIGQEE